MTSLANRSASLPRLGFLVSGRGSNMQAVIEACRAGRILAAPSVVISSSPSAEALKRAGALNVKSLCLDPREKRGDHDLAVVEALGANEVDVVLLVGYVRKLGPQMLQKFAGRIINIHPALLPKYGGQGMYGLNVHRAVLAAGERQTGATVHLVQGEYDTGPILAQAVVDVLPDDTPETLALRVLAAEHKLLVQAVADFLKTL